MSRVHVLRPVLDEFGNLLAGASVTLRDAVFGQPIAQTIFSNPDPTDTTALTNPLVVTTGILDFWLNTPQRINMLVTYPGRPDIQVFVDADPAAEQIVRTANPLQIVGTPTTGQVLTKSAVAGQAVWATPSGVGLTATSTVVSYDFSSGSVPGAFTALSVNPGSAPKTGTPIISPLPSPPVVVNITDAPSGVGFTYAKALAVPTYPGAGGGAYSYVTANVSSGGRVKFWIRPQVSISGVQSQVFAAPSSSSDPWTRTVLFSDAAENGQWQFCDIELPPVTSGQVTIWFGSFNSNGLEAPVLIAGVVFESGGINPAHTHAGSGSPSVQIGTSATATAANTVAVGDGAQATAAGTTAVGTGAHASVTNATAVGSGAIAPVVGGVAVGFGAVIGGSADNAICIGTSSSATGVESIAIGHLTSASGYQTVSIGANAGSSGSKSVAVGSAAAAGADNSVALGEGATVSGSHVNSVALGAGAATTAANQIMLGNGSHLVVALGGFRSYGDTILASSGSRLGFYGTLGTTQQTVTGSRSANAALASLLTALAAMGLIVDGSTV